MMFSRKTICLACCALAGQAAAPLGLASHPAAEDTFTYADHSFGFELKLPSNWEYDRARYPGSGGSIGLLRGWFQSGQRSLKLEMYRSHRPMAFPAWVSAFEKRIARVPGTERLETTIRNETRGDRVIEATGATFVAESKRYYICVPFDAQTVWVMSLAALGNDPVNLQAAEATIETAYRTLEVHYSPADRNKLSVALQRGEDLVKQLGAAAAAMKIDSQTQYYELIGPDGPIGYATHRTSREIREKKPGWRVREQSWEFGRDGAARYVRINAFAALDLSSEQIETRADHISSAKEKSPVLTTLDQCVREGRSLFTTYSRSDEPRSFEGPPPVKTGPAYLPRALLRQLPALLGREEGAWHAFVIYDAQVRALLFHSIRCAGRSKTRADAGKERYLYEVREGFAAASAIIKTDGRGRLLEYVAGDSRLVARGKGYIEQKYGPRRDAAARRLPK